MLIYKRKLHTNCTLTTDNQGTSFQCFFRNLLVCSLWYTYVVTSHIFLVVLSFLISRQFHFISCHYFIHLALCWSTEMFTTPLVSDNLPFFHYLFKWENVAYIFWASFDFFIKSLTSCLDIKSLSILPPY